MSKIKAAWTAMSSPARATAVGGLILPLVVVVAVVFAAVGIAPGRPAQPSPTGNDIGALPTDAPPAPSPSPSALPVPSGSGVPSAEPTPPPPVADPLLGNDGRLTVLLLGTDYRPAHPGNRTDAMMVVSVDPTTGKAAAFSVPRDVVDFPLPERGTFPGKINGLYQYLQSRTNRGAANTMKAFGRAFDIEIDNYVLIGFSGVQALVSAVGGVDVRLQQSYHDPLYWVNGHTRGWGLPAGKSHLNAANALIFARSRKGDSDFGRARRQQILVMAAFAKVRKRGLDDLPKLIRIARDTVRTDLPLDKMTALFKLYRGVDLGKAKKVVFGPKVCAVRAGGFDYHLVFTKCNAWVKKYFPKARPFGTWPATAVPSGSVPPSQAAPGPTVVVPAY
jgi:polyisoprenyl-teichoic acid--peptidoglycan teichoic acid transferase